MPCLVVEAKPELASLLEEHDVPHLTADPIQEAVQRRAGVEQAGGLLCAVDSDAINVYITLTARAMNPRLTIVAGASDPGSADKLRRAGADHVVSPYEVSGSRMGVLALHPAIVSFLDMVRVAPGVAAGGGRGPAGRPAGRHGDRADPRRASRGQDPRRHPARRRRCRLSRPRDDAGPR